MKPQIVFFYGVTWPQFDFQSSSTCISECGTPSWACLALLLSLALNRQVLSLALVRMFSWHPDLSDWFYTCFFITLWGLFYNFANFLSLLKLCNNVDKCFQILQNFMLIMLWLAVHIKIRKRSYAIRFSLQNFLN